MIEQRISSYRILENQLGCFVLMVTDGGEVNSTWLSDDGWAAARISGAKNDQRLLPELTGRLRCYFAGEPVDFANENIPSGPDFWRRCWKLCRGIPAGQTCSYGELARRAGRTPVAARAVGQAMRHNPLPVIVPCHRVIASSGRLHGFGGTSDPASQALELKRRLLQLEGWDDHSTCDASTLFDASLNRDSRSLMMTSASR
jgi:methylated-DNA-[protein]-cysteine S-methyltransferase